MMKTRRTRSGLRDRPPPSGARPDGGTRLEHTIQVMPTGLLGRAAAALLAAPDLMERSGSIQWVEDLAEEFYLSDEHGKRPPGYPRRQPE